MNKRTKKRKGTESFLGAIQYLSKDIENYSAQTDILKQFSKRYGVEVDRRKHGSVRKFGTKDHGDTVSGTV